MLGVFPFVALIIVARDGLAAQRAAGAPHLRRGLRLDGRVVPARRLGVRDRRPSRSGSSSATSSTSRRFFFIGLMVWIGQRSPRPWWALAPAALFTAALPAALPLNNFLNDTAVHDTVGLLAIWRWRDRLFSAETIDEVVIGAAIAARSARGARSRGATRIVVPIALFLYYAAVSRPVEARIEQASHGAWEAGCARCPTGSTASVGPERRRRAGLDGRRQPLRVLGERSSTTGASGRSTRCPGPYDAFGQRQGGDPAGRHGRLSGPPAGAPVRRHRHLDEAATASSSSTNAPTQMAV